MNTYYYRFMNGNLTLDTAAFEGRRPSDYTVRKWLVMICDNCQITDREHVKAEYCKDGVFQYSVRITDSKALLQRIADRGIKEQSLTLKTSPKKVTRQYKGMWRMYAQALRRLRKPLMDKLMVQLYDFPY